MNTPRQLNILNVEGPAGAGKTTLINDLFNQGSGKFYTVSVPKATGNRRDYQDTDNGAADSMAKDITQYLWILKHAFNNSQVNETIYITDRWVVSQFVYGNLRLGNDFDPERFDHYMRHSTSNLAGLTAEWLTRQLNMEGEVTLDVRVIPLYYLPFPDIISLRRTKTGKDYPYEVMKEHSFYLDLVDFVVEEGFGEHTLEAYMADVDIKELEISIMNEMIEVPKQYDTAE